MSQTAPVDPDDLPAGTTFGRHSIVRRVAVGGMAAVYEARHLDLGKRVALKVMRKELATQPTLVQRFVLEARAASRLSHPHVIAVSDVGVEHDLPYMVMDFLEGEDLFDALQGSGPMPLARLADIALPVLSAVAAAHAERILHRDLKPENVFLVQTRYQRLHPVLLDFGISKPVEARRGEPRRSLTGVGEVVGTPDYMAPEQLCAAPDIDGRADQYALGMILYECATGVHPYRTEPMTALVAAILTGRAPPPSHHRPDLPAAFDALVLRAISASRDARFASVADLGRALWPMASPLAQALWAEEFGSPAGPERAAPVRSATGTLAPVQPETRAVAITPDDLRVFGAFEACEHDELEDLLRRVQGRAHEAGATLVTQGAHGNGCYLLVRGEVEIVKSTTHARWVLGRLPAGSVFGQIALVDRLPRTASVIAKTDVVVIHIDRATFDELLAATTPVAERLRLHVAISGIRQLRRATRRLTTLSSQRGVANADQQRDLAYVQAAAQEWELPLADDE